MKKHLHISPSQKILFGFALMILVGALLLNLPIASKSGESIGFLNALFTATSANCVTGLVVVNMMEHWTWFGKIIILILIQFGALGFMTVMTVFLLLLKRKIPLGNRRAIQASFNQDNIGGMVRLVKKVVFVTILCEAVGAAALTVSFYMNSSMSLPEAVYQGIFHSITAFCNAGFDNIGTESLVAYNTVTSLNIIIMALIIAGGIGFIVWSELGHLVRNPHKKSLRNRIAHLSLHTKITLSITAFLIVFGAVFFLVLEWHNPETLGPLTFGQKVQSALFQSVSLRTAGFNTISQSGLTELSKFVSCILMLIGGSPASAAGGIKTVTFGVIVISVISVLKGRNKLVAFHRTLPLDLLQKSLAVVGTMLFVVFTSTVLLYFTEQGSQFPHTFMDLLFETCSAAGTVGVTTGITPFLSSAGKAIIILCMFLGRLGPITVVVALNVKLHDTSDDGIGYINERVIIG